VLCRPGGGPGRGPRRADRRQYRVTLETWNVSSLAGGGAAAPARYAVVGLTSTHRAGSGTKLLEEVGLCSFLELPRVSGAGWEWGEPRAPG